MKINKRNAHEEQIHIRSVALKSSKVQKRIQLLLKRHAKTEHMRLIFQSLINSSIYQSIKQINIKASSFQNKNNRRNFKTSANCMQVCYTHIHHHNIKSKQTKSRKNNQNNQNLICVKQKEH